MSLKREVWIDYIKVFACILVALGHFFQSMVAAEILPETELHTLFAAPCRVLLMRIGITNAPIQIGIGVAVSFIGPIVAMMIMEKIKLDFLVYPGKLIKKGSKSGTRAV